MRIGITGAHGVGKTMLARELSRRLNLPLIEEQARVVAKIMGVRNCNELLKINDLARDFQVAVLMSQAAMEEIFSRGFVSDRTTLDCLAYWRLYGLKESGVYAGKCLSREYDLLVYVPRREEFGELDGIIAGILRNVPAPVVEVSGPPEGALKTIERELKKRWT